MTNGQAQAHAVEAVVEEVEAEVEEVVLSEDDIYKANAFTPQEAAKELGGVASGWTGKRLRRYIRGGQCKARKIGGRWYCTVEDLEGLLGVLEAAEQAKAEKAAAEQEAVVEVEVEVEAGDPLS